MPQDLSGLSVRELLALWARALRELRDRGVVRTFNNPNRSAAPVEKRVAVAEEIDPPGGLLRS